MNVHVLQHVPFADVGSVAGWLETQRDMIYVRSFDPVTRSASGSSWLVSKGGGDRPLWRGDGKELFVLNWTAALKRRQLTSSAPAY
jgi:hypothetical protein